MVQDFTKLPDNVLVQKVKDDACSDSFIELSKRHSDLFYKVCHSYLLTLNSLGIPSTEIFEEKDIVFLNSIRKFDCTKGVLFSTWLGNYTRYFCLNKINKTKKMPEVGDEKEIEFVFNAASIQDFETQKKSLDSNIIYKLLDECGDSRIIDIFKLRYDPMQRKKKTWAKIADELNLSIPTTILLHKKGLKLLREEIETKKIDIFQDL